MAETVVMMIPVDAKFCVDLIRFSDGGHTPGGIGELAQDQILSLLEFNYDTLGPQFFGDRAIEFADIYFPDIAERWRREDRGDSSIPGKDAKPLVWKEVTIAHGSAVRMQYGREMHFAKVEDGRVVDEDGAYSPSEWASKVAGGTQRNAWRDLWVKEPAASTWVPAQLLRQRAQEALLEGIELDVET